MSPAPLIVLVTGTTGYIGAEIAVQFLEKGFNVRQTIRKESQALAWDEKYPQYKGRVTFSLIKALDTPHAFDEAVKGVTYIAHAASPVTFESEDCCRDVLDPAINGTTSILRSALAQESIKAVVITSSVVANFDVVNGPAAGTIVTDKTWNPITYAEAAAFPRENPNHGAVLYSASKALAERAAWEFMETEKPSFTLTTIAPTWVLGPTAEPAVKTQKDVRSTAGMTFHAIVDAKVIPSAVFNPTFVDVRDIARVHVGAVLVPHAAGKRYILVGGRFNNECACAAAAKAVPEQAHRFASVEKAPFGETYEVDASQAERDFGFTYITLEQSVGDLAKHALELRPLEQGQSEPRRGANVHPPPSPPPWSLPSSVTMLIPLSVLLSFLPLALASSQIHFAPPSSPYHPTHIVQSVEVGGSLTRSTTVYTLKHDASTRGGEWVFAVPGQQGFLEAWEDKRTGAGKNELEVVKLGDGESNVSYYSVSPTSGDTGSSTVSVHRVVSHLTFPKPKSLPQKADFIGMLWNVDLLDTVAGLTPEEVSQLEQVKIKVKTPTPRILETSAPEGFELDHTKGGATVTFTSKGSLSGLEPQIASVLYQQPEAVASYRKLDRLIEVSHWGSNLAVQDSIDLFNSGPELRGTFSRLDYQFAKQQGRAGAMSINTVKLVLPNAVTSPYFYDIVGNVSTSRFRRSAPPSQIKLARTPAQRKAAQASLLQLTPRYPLFGGWNYTFTIGYDAPLADYLGKKAGGEYVLAVPFLTELKDTAIDNATVTIRLPESARNIRVHTPFPVDSITYPTAPPSFFAHTNPGYVKTYLDSTGHPTIVMNKLHCTDRHNGLVLVEYTSSPLLDVLQKPTAIATVLFSFFLVTILAKRIEWGFST